MAKIFNFKSTNNQQPVLLWSMVTNPLDHDKEYLLQSHQIISKTAQEDEADRELAVALRIVEVLLPSAGATYGMVAVAAMEQPSPYKKHIEAKHKCMAWNKDPSHSPPRTMEAE